MIAKSIQAVCGNEPVEMIKQIHLGILVISKNVKQYRLLQHIQMVGNIPVKVEERVQGTKGVIHGVPLDMSEEDVLNETKGQRLKFIL